MVNVSQVPEVSVIIPAYNGEKYLAEAINSVITQEGVACEIIVVDDGSSDATEDVARAYGEKLKYFKKSNGGVASARNYGIRRAQGTYVALLDQDDRFLPGKLAQQLALMSAQPDAVACHSNMRMISAEGLPLAASHLGHDADNLPPSGAVFARLFQGNFIFACTAFFRRDVAIAVGLFREDIWGADDYNLWLRLARNGQILYMNAVLSEYRWHSDNASHDQFKMAVARLLARERLMRFLPSGIGRGERKEMRRIVVTRTAESSYPFYKNSHGAQARELLHIGLRVAPTSPLLWKMYIATFLN